jgi:hypothetical protein
MTDFEPPRVDGIANDWVPMVTIDDVLRLDALGLSATDIAARLHVTVLDVEASLRRVALLKALSGAMGR